MLKLIVFLVAVSAVWGFPRAGKPSFKKFGRPIPSGRIVGGHDADIADYPYQLALTWYGFQICGASIIGSNWAVTAAHCTDGSSASSLQVLAGTTDLSGGQSVQVATLYQNPQFNRNTFDYDISVLELEEDITIANAAPIPLHDGGFTAPEGTDITITGWGNLEEGGPSPDVLQVVVTKVVSNEVCNEAYQGLLPVTDRMICAGNLAAGGEDACQGDSGGPLVVAGKLYATVSWGYGCARAGYPGVNGKVSEPSMREYVTSVSGI